MSPWLKRWLLMPLFMALMTTMTGCGDPYLSALTPKGPVADIELSLIKLSLYIMLGVFLIVMAIFVYVLIKYRKRKGQEGIPVQVEGNHKLEITWTVIPILLIAILSIPSIKTTFDLAQRYDNQGLKIKVIGHQFWWEFQYPDQKVVTAQDLYIPVGKKIQIDLESRDVVHSFWVPALAGKEDTNPGMTNHMWLQADQPGVYKGKCAELCGPSHALMEFKVIALEPAKFDAWMNNMKALQAKKSITTTNTALEPAVATFKSNCMACHAIDGQGGPIAPNLATVGDREKIAGILSNNRQNIIRWVTNPQDVKPGAKMPAFGGKLNEQQIASLADYLTSLKAGE